MDRETYIKREVRRIVAWALLTLFSLLVAIPVVAQEPTLETLTIHVPGSKGGGFDKVAIAIEETLEAEGLVNNVELVHSPGAGGLISLTAFLRQEPAQEYHLFLGGRSNIGASVFNRSDVTLTDATAIARLVGPTIVVAVSQDSSIQDLSDLISVYRSDPTAIKWIGGSVGSQDELLLLEMSHALGINRRDINFQSVPGGGSDIVTEVLGGRVNVLLSSYEEIKTELNTGALRAITVMPDASNAKFGATRLSRYNIDLEGNDWKGIFAPSGTHDVSMEELENMFAKMVDTPTWHEQLTENLWSDEYQSSEAFAEFVGAETELIKDFRARYAASPPSEDRVSGVLADQFRWLILAIILIGLLTVFLVFQRYLAKRKQKELEQSLETVEGELEKKLESSKTLIEENFSKWRLTESENEIGWLLLKGLSFKEIAEARGTSERTVRQQARSVYAKSGLSSRSELSAFFFEDLVFGQS